MFIPVLPILRMFINVFYTLQRRRLDSQISITSIKVGDANKGVLMTEEEKKKGSWDNSSFRKQLRKLELFYMPI